MQFWELILSYYDTYSYTSLSLKEPEQLVYLILGVFIGAIAAIIGTFTSRRACGTIVARFIGAGALSRDTAKTPAELGIPMSFAVALRAGRMLRKTVRAVTDPTREQLAAMYFPRSGEAKAESGAEAASKTAAVSGSATQSVRASEPQSTAAATAEKPGRAPYLRESAAELMKTLFYIPEEKSEAAARRFRLKGSGIWDFVFSLLFVITVAVAVYLLLPHALKLLDNALSAL